MPFSVRNVYNIASASLSGIYSQKSTLILTLFAAVFIVWGEYIFPFNLGENFKSTVDISTSAIFMCGTLMSIWNAVFSIKQDLTTKTIWTILTKPVSRLEYLLGKTLGVWLATLFAYLFWAPLFLVTAWVEFCYQRSSLWIGYNCLCIYILTIPATVAVIGLLWLIARKQKGNIYKIVMFLDRAKWLLAVSLGAVFCAYFASYNLLNAKENLGPSSLARLADISYEWRILPALAALLELHFLTILIGITAAMMWSLPMALIGTLLLGFAAELLPALWIPHVGIWLPFPVADALRLSEPLTEVLSMQQPLGTYWLALASQTLPWLAFSGGLLMFARYYLGQHDLADG